MKGHYNSTNLSFYSLRRGDVGCREELWLLVNSCVGIGSGWWMQSFLCCENPGRDVRLEPASQAVFFMGSQARLLTDRAFLYILAGMKASGTPGLAVGSRYWPPAPWTGGAQLRMTTALTKLCCVVTSLSALGTLDLHGSC